MNPDNCPQCGPDWYYRIGADCDPTHMQARLNHINLHYWRDGFHSLFARYERCESALAAIANMSVSADTDHAELSALMIGIAKATLGQN